MNGVANRRRGQLQRVTAENLIVADEVLRTAAFFVPEDQTQRQAFVKLMPHVSVLRSKGYTWDQIAKILSQCGFNLQSKTLSGYFRELFKAKEKVADSWSNSTNRSQDQLHRISAENFTLADELLRAASIVTSLEEQQSFEKLMPYLYFLRNEGCTWAKIAKLLGEDDFKVQVSTLRSYFSEISASKNNSWHQKMQEQAAALAKIRNKTAGADFSEIPYRVNKYISILQQI